MNLFLGIEIGGTKLQLGVSTGDGSPLVALERRDVVIALGAQAIRDDLAAAGLALKKRFDLKAVGYGFGGPIDASKGVITRSHQVEGWDGFPIVRWTQETLGLPVFLGNDCDMAALAEARFGAGRESRCVFYITVGTGIGGGLVIDGNVHGSDQPAAAEIGHLRPSLDPLAPDVEALAAGPGLTAAARNAIASILAVGDPTTERAAALRLLEIAGGLRAPLTARHLADAASEGNIVASRVLRRGTDVLGWAIAQVITLIAPQTIIVGGGVSLMGDVLFYEPLRKAVAAHVFPPLRDSYRIVAPALGEEVVVHGAAAMAREHLESNGAAKPGPAIES
ncbi:MAG: ROK family protein [Phycisphaeraceae bacterium]